jgi:hypothetical protein
VKYGVDPTFRLREAGSRNLRVEEHLARRLISLLLASCWLPPLACCLILRMEAIYFSKVLVDFPGH